MIDPEKRKAIYYLHTQSKSIKKIARDLRVDRNTVRTIIEQKGKMPETTRSDKIELCPELISRPYRECAGYAQRIYERLTEDYDIVIGYSTLTGIIRDLQLRKRDSGRCDQVADQPGAEMQHDTSDFKVKFRATRVKLIGSLLYFRFSKVRYLKFYYSFNRFTMKCFFHEALMFWKYSAPVCIIDNTSLARLRGTGKNAVIVPEMEQFAKNYGFSFVCHEKGHANRKAGNERGFYTSIANFFPGREFMDLEDLNRQALDWATVHGNFYWTSGTGRHEVKVLRYPDHIKIFHQQNLLIEYPLPPVQVKNQKFYPPDRPKPRHEPRDRKNRTGEEEKILRSMSETIDAYLNFALDKQPAGQKHRFVRNLFRLSRRLSPELFEKAVNRALSYRVTDPDTIYRIAVLQMKEANYELPFVPVDADFVNRPSYLEGRFTDDADLSRYSNPKEDENGSGPFEDA